MKKILAMAAVVFVAFAANAQQSPAQKAISNPSRKQQEAKAEKVLADSTRRHVIPPAKTPASTKKKCTKASCCKKKSS